MGPRLSLSLAHGRTDQWGPASQSRSDHARRDAEATAQRPREVTVVREPQIYGDRRERGLPGLETPERDGRAKIREIAMHARPGVRAELMRQMERRAAHGPCETVEPPGRLWSLREQLPGAVDATARRGAGGARPSDAQGDEAQ